MCRTGRAVAGWTGLDGRRNTGPATRAHLLVWLPGPSCPLEGLSPLKCSFLLPGGRGSQVSQVTLPAVGECAVLHCLSARQLAYLEVLRSQVRAYLAVASHSQIIRQSTSLA